MLFSNSGERQSRLASMSHLERTKFYGLWALGGLIVWMAIIIPNMATGKVWLYEPVSIALVWICAIVTSVALGLSGANFYRHLRNIEVTDSEES